MGSNADFCFWHTVPENDSGFPEEEDKKKDHEKILGFPLAR